VNTNDDKAMAASNAIIHDDKNADVLLILETIECIVASSSYVLVDILKKGATPYTLVQPKVTRLSKVDWSCLAAAFDPGGPTFLH